MDLHKFLIKYQRFNNMIVIPDNQFHLMDDIILKYLCSHKYIIMKNINNLLSEIDIISVIFLCGSEDLILSDGRTNPWKNLIVEEGIYPTNNNSF